MDPKFVQVIGDGQGGVFALDADGGVWQYKWAYVETKSAAGWAPLSTKRFPV